MRAVIQRVKEASVATGSAEVASIGQGLLILLGVSPDDDPTVAEKFARKIAALRVFEDSDGRMNLDLAAVGGAVLCVSQFTLYGDVRRGNRPSFARAASGEHAEPLYRRFCEEIEAMGLHCGRGIFGAEMAVALVNDGPVTLMLDSDSLAEPRRA